ncbi:divergent polysaccharide deacetylase family protein, partial [Roseicyclus sp.]|uniref:divergent polysaccharide deacetylase family protein n=1 Tax=Roseicyclus sp. TaxID=1914329 RepID=UPI003F9F18BB
PSDPAPEAPRDAAGSAAPAAMSDAPLAVAEAPAVEPAAPELQPAPPAAVVQLVPAREGGALGVATADAEPTELAQAEAPAMAPAPRILRPAEPDAGARTLPQIVAPGRTEPPAPPEEETAEAAPEAPAADEDVPALVAHAAPFDAAETRPLIAVVLIDEPDARLDISALTDFTFPVAFAIDPTRPDAAERAAAYRAAGFEVLMLGSVIPEGATATDTEVALAAARRNLPEAVALLDTPESRIQSDRAVLEAAVGAVAREGQGLVAFPRGMNTAEQMAARVDVPAATVFRLLDDEDQRATLITRFLARAEFAAVQEGAVIVAGRTRPDTVTALYSWALGDRNEGVAIAPVSAVLLRLAEE